MYLSNPVAILTVFASVNLAYRLVQIWRLLTSVDGRALSIHRGAPALELRPHVTSPKFWRLMISSVTRACSLPGAESLFMTPVGFGAC